MTESIETLAAEFDRMFKEYSTESEALQEQVATFTPSQKLIELTRMQFKMEKIQAVEQRLKSAVLKEVRTAEHREKTTQPKDKKNAKETQAA